MPDQSPSDRPTSDRFKAEMPQIPGVTVPLPRPARYGKPSLKLVIALVAVLVVAFFGVRWALRPGRVDSKAAEPQAQIEVPPPAPDPSTLIPHATEASPAIATIEEMARPWASKQFFIRNIVSGVDVPGLLIRLPGGSPSRANGYLAFAVDAPYGNCRLEYITNLARLRTEWQDSVDALLSILDQKALLDRNPPLARTIRNRFPYIDPLHHLQVELVRRWRAGHADERERLGIHLAINGIAAGLRNTG